MSCARFAKFFGGNASYAFAQMVCLIIVAKLGSQGSLANYLLALAFATPIAAFFNYSFRQLVIADYRRETTFKVFDRTRLLLAVTALLLAFSILWMSSSYFQGWGMAMLLVLASKLQDGRIELAVGALQREDRFEKISRIYLMKSGAIVCACALGMPTFGLPGFLGILILSNTALGYWAVHLVDQKGGAHEGAISALLRRGFPLAASALLISLSINLPRLGIEAVAGRDVFAIFSTSLQLSLPAVLLVVALSQFWMPQLTRASGEGDVSQFRSIYRRLLLLACGIGLLCAAGYLVAARLILTSVFDLEIGSEAEGLIPAISVLFLVNVLLNGANFLLIAAKVYKTQLVVTLITTALFFVVIALGEKHVWNAAIMTYAFCTIGLAQLALAVAISDLRTKWRSGHERTV